MMTATKRAMRANALIDEETNDIIFLCSFSMTKYIESTRFAL